MVWIWLSASYLQLEPSPVTKPSVNLEFSEIDWIMLFLHLCHFIYLFLFLYLEQISFFNAHFV